MTVPRFLLAIIILYILAFRLNAQNFGTFFSSQYGGAPWSWAKFVDLLQHVWPVILIATFGGLAYNMRVMRGEPARHAQRPICRDRAGQGAARSRR